MTQTLKTDNYIVCFVNSEQSPKYKPLEVFKYSYNSEQIRFFQLFEETYERYVNGEHVCNDVLINWREISILPQFKKAFIAACDLQSGLYQFKA